MKSLRPNNAPLVRAGLFFQVVDTLQALNQPIIPLLSSAGISEAWLEADVDDLMPLLFVYRLYEQAARKMGVVSFGALVSEQPVRRIGNFGRIILESLTVYDALRNIVKLYPSFGSLHAPFLKCESSGNNIWLGRYAEDGIDNGIGPMQSELWGLHSAVNVIRQATGQEWSPVRMQSIFGRSVLPELQKVKAFQHIPVSVGQPWGGIAIQRSDLALLMPAYYAPLNTSQLNEWLSTGPALGLIGSLRQLVISMIKLKIKTQISEVSDAIGIHPRTLQRLLAEEQLTFRQLVSQSRFLVARQWMKERNRSLTDIAFNLGYSDLANFNRAFYHWAGVSPSEYRRQTDS